MSTYGKQVLQRAAVATAIVSVLLLALGGRQLNRWLVHHHYPAPGMEERTR